LSYSYAGRNIRRYLHTLLTQVWRSKDFLTGGIDLPVWRLYLSSSDLRSTECCGERKQTSSNKTSPQPTRCPLEQPQCTVMHVPVRRDAFHKTESKGHAWIYLTAQYLHHTASTGRLTDKLRRIWIEIFACRYCGKPRKPTSEPSKPMPVTARSCYVIVLGRNRGQ
jgi:hypothetical protein